MRFNRYKKKKIVLKENISNSAVQKIYYLET